MATNAPVHTGRHFLQIPGPSNVPDRVLRAMDMPTIDHRGPEFAKLGFEVMESCKTVFRTSQPVLIYPSSGTGAWEAAIVNTLSPGDKVLMAETGHFAALWRALAERFGLDVDFLPGDWRSGADPAAIEAKLTEDKAHQVKAVMVVHNETSSGVTSRVAEIRKAIDRAAHPALLLVDTVSSLGSITYEHDGWGVDVTVSGSQKGLMLPPGLSFNAISEKALAASKANKMPRSYWDWSEQIAANKSGSWPYTPATNLLYGLKEAIAMLHEEGLENVFARHRRHGAATRAAVKAWGLEVLCRNPEEYSPVVTAVLMPEGHDADRFRQVVLDHLDMSLGTGLAKVKGKVFRIGHLGHFNDLMLMGTLAGVEMGLELARVPYRTGGVLAAMNVLTGKEAAAA
ncbi:alanine--glyoxylate aminotransferase family protein [Bradyrhizobium sp. WD16]|uniref:pyridoxal-phosphate-dependent aminotransferase family protein n=1 Tax=Bradyrhizobium sp. WD16 TaxID=1521768 RepID=UPI0020A33E1C|nr:aminotransferase class V-fold PLP-dependent enzyme [Bradyrhizobium sp. WD16]UTD29645.1 serine--glyoxylate aminotransferase [Bradyrhizobium sp. WD16]